MHVVYIITAINWVLDKFVNSKKIKNIILIFFLIFFAVFTGGSASCIRACVMMIIILISEIIYRKNDFLTTWCFSLIFILFLNFYNIENIGMWLSFMCVLGMKKINLKDSFAVQIMIFPIILYSYNTISFTFFISNFFASFIVGPILILGYICLFLGKFLGFLVVIEELLLELLFKIAEIVGNFELSKIYVVSPNIIFFVIYYLILFFIIFVPREVKNKIFLKVRQNFNIIKKYLIISLCIVSIFLLFLNLSKDDLTIDFLDVAQGDCTLITTKTGKRILVDGGDCENYDYGENVVLPYLLKHGISSLDYILVSHFDSDHCGGLFSIIENLKIKNIIFGYQYEETEYLLEFLKLADSKNINIIIVSNNDIVKIDEFIYFEIFSPFKDDMITENAINNNSVVAKLNFSKNNFSTSILFTGDIEAIAEEKLVLEYGNKLKSDILKVAHHGSITSTTDEFLENVNPKIALIGVGKNNSYGHPSQITIQNLNKAGATIHRTDQSGQITITLKNKKFQIKTY